MKLVLVAVTVGLMLMGCNNRKDEGSPVVVRGDARGGGNQGGQMQPGTNTFGSQNVVLTSTQSQSGYQQTVVNFLASSGIDPSVVGNITSVEVSGQVRTDMNTAQMIPTQSFIKITIRDNLMVDGQQMEPISFTIAGKQGYAQNNTTDLLFEDRFGTIRVQGQYNGSNFQGTVSFTGYNPQSQGILGTFTVSTCGFFICN